MFAIVMFILMIYLFYFGFNIYYDLIRRPKQDKDPNYFVQYEMDKPEKKQREEVLQKDFAGILKPNSPRLSKSSTASLTNPRTSFPSMLRKPNSFQAQVQYQAKKSSRFARWRVESRRTKTEDDVANEGNGSFLMEEPDGAILGELARKERQEAVTRRVFENINRSGRRVSKQREEPKSSEDEESFLQPLVFDRVERKGNQKVHEKVHEKDREVIVDSKTEPSASALKKASPQSSRTASSNKRISVSGQNQALHKNIAGNTRKPIAKRAVKEVEELNETKEVQDSKAKWRQLMNLAETSIVVERVDGIKVYKSTLFDSNTEAES